MKAMKARTKKTRPEAPPSVPSGVDSTLEQIKTLIADETAVEKLLSSVPRAQQLFTVLSEFAEIDYQSEQQSTPAGEVFHTILALPLETQKKLVWNMADTFRVERPSYEHEGAGRPTTGRNELALVVYSRHPDMHLKDKGKDTRAAKRITDHVRRYLIKTGQRQTRKAASNTTEGSDISQRALKVVFAALWDASQSENERRVVVGLFLRLGVTGEVMDKWSNHGLLALAAAPLSAINIEAAG